MAQVAIFWVWRCTSPPQRKPVGVCAIVVSDSQGLICVDSAPIWAAIIEFCEIEHFRNYYQVWFPMFWVENVSKAHVFAHVGVQYAHDSCTRLRL